jgi:hypothetical protein
VLRQCFDSRIIFDSPKGKAKCRRSSWTLLRHLLSLLCEGRTVSAHIITRLALDTFSREELAQVRLAARALREPGESGVLILAGRPELYRLAKTREGVELELCDEATAAACLGGNDVTGLSRQGGYSRRSR